MPRLDRALRGLRGGGRPRFRPPPVNYGTGQLGTALVQFSASDASPARITAPSDLLVTLGGSVTVTYCLIGAATAWIDKRDGTVINLTCDGAQHTASFTPAISGDLPLVAVDSAGGVVSQPLPFVVRDSPALSALDPTASATRTSAQDGPWTTGSTWSGGGVPGPDDVVSVSHAVATSGRSGRAGRLLIQSGGSVTVSGGVLALSDVHVKSGGTLRVDANGVGNQPAILLLRNRTQHANDTAGNSPDGQAGFWPAVQVDSGGSLVMTGPGKTAYARCAAEPLAGHTQVSLDLPVAGWQVGDRVLIPDSRQYTNADFTANAAAGGPVRKYDVAVVRGVSFDGKTVYLLNPLAWSHPGARDLDGNLVPGLLPHVVNLYRQALFVTTDPTTIATRAHVRLNGRAACDLTNYVLHGTGRTTNADLSSSNRDGRLPLYLDGVIGPAAPLSHGDQAHVENGVILDPPPVVPEPQAAWAITLENTHYCTLKNNVCFNWAGAGIFIRDDRSAYNVIDGNFVSVVRGVGNRFGEGAVQAGLADNGQHGMGIEVCAPFTRVVNNVVNNVTKGGKDLHVGIALMTAPQRSQGFTRNLPAYQGADPDVNFVAVNVVDCPFGLSGTGDGDFEGNEVYGCCDMGFEWWFINCGSNFFGASAVMTYFDDTTVWHTHNQIGFPYYANHVTVRRMRAYCELANLLELSGGPGSRGVYTGDYRMTDVHFVDCHFEGLAGVFYPSTAGAQCNIAETFTAEIRDSYVRCKNTVLLADRWNSGGSLAASFGTRVVTLDGNTYVAPGSGLSWDVVELKWGDQGGNANYVAADLVYLLGHGGHDYRCYWQEQATAYVVPATGTAGPGSPWGCPEAGLTHQQMHDKYQPPNSSGVINVKPDAPNAATPGLCVKGALLPGGATTLAGVVGTDGGLAYVVQTA